MNYNVFGGMLNLAQATISRCDLQVIVSVSNTLTKLCC